MSFTYEVIKMEEGITAIKRIDASGAIAWIPEDLTNSDYQAYLISEAKTK